MSGGDDSRPVPENSDGRLGEGIPYPEAAAGFPGEPDGFQRLWTPHRMVYIDGQDKPKDDRAEECPFCTAPSKSDEDGLIVARGQHVYAVLNLYPYNPGHLLVCPYRHVADYTDLTLEETVELAEFTQKAMRVIRSVSGPHGFNLGMNQGPVAGAGIAAHLHQHVVPRWGGDANFLPVIAQTKALPQVHADVQARLKKEWNR
ncbi:Diadenosine tetraphosphate (Ap4A) hydrolase [Brevibacterium iodinum ATCC 49514]|uniref:Diadenosine tetraphosphate (Ap4A) hydrolase n=1 Tax=Brevibacterium iodinum ATCC 49514 TaxID=1255616 RepID=A0A2H1KC84_9MICO|nr:HIT domain-containing protein [Brevibacterium iodinum]SMX97417.1 Diadenosine tetraphosphate (Ap4A) hydrolase [Brevibacterium iodinum ATCC 49514]SUW12690.1 AP-4-A phosphorylase [Brevibacterium iodinum]